MPALENLQLACAVVRIGLYSLFCKLCCKKSTLLRPEFSPICLGLDGSGKSTLLCQLSGESCEAITPTKGFSVKAVQFKNCILNVKEIGGGEKVRPFWKHYYAGAHGVIYVVDSASDNDVLDTARGCLHEALNQSALSGLPCLVLANCQDKPGARNKDEIYEALELDDVSKDRCLVVQTCSMKDISQAQKGFEEFNAALLPSTDAEAGVNAEEAGNSGSNRV